MGVGPRESRLEFNKDNITIEVNSRTGIYALFTKDRKLICVDENDDCAMKLSELLTSGGPCPNKAVPVFFQWEPSTDLQHRLDKKNKLKAEWGVMPICDT